MLQINRKKFDNRNKLKITVHYSDEKEFYVNVGEVWYVNLGENIGFEENGKGDEYKRPVLVLKKQGNMFLCIAMTTKGKDNNRFYYKIPEAYFARKSYLILSQIRTLDKKRFIKKVGEVSKDDIQDIRGNVSKFWF